MSYIDNPTDDGAGATGPQGPPGSEGPPGEDGADGVPGPQGEAGAAGSSGADGAPGSAGPPGADGVDGADGDAGPPGPQGATGATGAAGAAGAAGADGAPGTPGVDGEDGDPGPPGPPGAAGATGATGAAGADGSQGPPGADGADGDPGDPGPPGPPGPTGATGATGAAGAAGADGAPGTPGLDGEDGDPGPPGAQGAQGPAGADGAAGAAGAQGPPGADGDDGDPGDPGPPGPAGDAGAQGAAGADGADGAAGSPGVDGEAGDPGDAGPPGPTGATGPEGPIGSVLAQVDLTGLTADVATATLFTPTSSHPRMLLIEGYAIVTTPASISSTLPSIVIRWTDDDTNVAQSLALTATQVGNSTTTHDEQAEPINVRAGTAITYETTGYTSVAAGMTYAIHLRVTEGGGPIGPAGVPGFDGEDGAQGDPGPPGPPGAAGAAGADGAQGPSGPPGLDCEADDDFGPTFMSNTVTGSGIPTQVAFWRETSVIAGDNDLYWDDTEKRLGVGITEPLAAVHAIESSATTADDVDALIVEVVSTGTPAAGFGPSISMRGASDTISPRTMSDIASVWTVAADATRTAELVFRTVSAAGAPTERLRAHATGIDIRLVDYTWPSAQGAASTVLTNDGSGNLSWAASSALNHACRVFRSTNQLITNNTVTALTFDSERFDTSSIHSTVSNTGRLTAPLAGVYQISATVQWASAGAQVGIRQIAIRLNGTTNIAQERLVLGGLGQYNQTISTLYKLALNDFVEVVVFQTSGISINIETAGNHSPEFGMVYTSAG